MGSFENTNGDIPTTIAIRLSNFHSIDAALKSSGEIEVRGVGERHVVINTIPGDGCSSAEELRIPQLLVAVTRYVEALRCTIRCSSRDVQLNGARCSNEIPWRCNCAIATR